MPNRAAAAASGGAAAAAVPSSSSSSSTSAAADQRDELAHHDVLLWMQEYAFATRHTELVDVFFKKLAPHKDGSQVDEDSLLVSRTNFYLFWKGTMEAQSFEDYVNQVQELMSGDLPIDNCSSLFDLKYLDSMLRCQALTALLENKKVRPDNFRQQVDALFPPTGASDSLPLLVKQLMDIVREEFFKLTVKLPRGAAAASAELYRRGIAIRERRSREWFAATFKKHLAQVEACCIGAPFLRQLARNVHDKKPDPLDGIADPLTVSYSAHQPAAAAAAAATGGGGAGGDGAAGVGVASAANKATGVVAVDTGFGASKRVSLAALRQVAGADWDAIANKTHPDVRAFLDAQEAVPAVATASTAAPGGGGKGKATATDAADQTEEEEEDDDSSVGGVGGNVEVEEEQQPKGGRGRGKGKGKAQSKSKGNDKGKGKSAAAVRAGLRSARRAVDAAGGDDPLAEALAQTSTKASAPRMRQEGSQDPNAEILTWEAAEQESQGADDDDSGGSGGGSPDTPIENRSPRRLPGSVTRRKKKRLSEIVGAGNTDDSDEPGDDDAEDDENKQPKRPRRRAARAARAPTKAASAARNKRVPFSREEKEYLIAGVEKFGKGQWAKILDAYPFHEKRTNVNLKDKWRNLEQSGEV